jgi:CRP-like cAMP-binding protein
MIGNLLLDSLPREERARIEDKFQRVHLPLHETLVEPGERIHYVYFPLDSMVSLVTLLESGVTIEAATVGNEGMTGMSTFHGLETSHTMAMVQMEGDALRMTTSDLKEALLDGNALGIALGRYTDALMSMLAQSAACNGLHHIDQRFARWLLTISDRVGRNDFTITQEFLSQMLGTQRPSVTISAGRLQEAGFIRYRRGAVEVLDRQSLEDISCECYDVIRELYEETFSRSSLVGESPSPRPLPLRR